MPAEFEPALAASGPNVAISGVIELNFALFTAECLRQPPRYGSYPCAAWAHAALSSRPDLLDRVGGFWGDSHAEWAEILILAHRGGMLFAESPAAFLESLDRLIMLTPDVPPLPSESPGVRETIATRVGRLRSSPETRSRYEEILREVWNLIEPGWRKEGLPAVRQRAARLEQQLAAGADLRGLLPRHHFVLRERHAPEFQAALERGEVTLVPLAVAGAGVAYFVLPGAVIVAFGPDAGAGSAKHRVAMERAAARFKVLSDPTRLSILDQVSYDDHTITDLARQLEVSQPTVSVHMKALREAGLVEPHREDGRTTYRAAPARTREFIEQALAEMGH